MMLRPAMKPADETPSGGGKRKPKPKPESRSNPYVAVPGDFLGPAPATPQTPSTANPPADRPAYGPENPPPPNYGGPPPVYPEVNAPSQTSSRSDDKKKPDKKKEASDKPQIAVPADFAQTEAKPDISALGLEFGWSRKFRLTHLQLETDNELVQGVAASLQHRRLFEHYLDDPIAYLKHFAEYGWDEESDRQAEAYIEKYAEEMKLHYAGQGRLWDALAWEATEHVREDLTNDRLESAVAVNIVTKEEIFRRFGDEDKTPLQEENRAMIKDPHNTALVHNHWNDSPGSQADFDAALWLGVRYLIVVTPSGMQYLYERDGDRMKLLDEIFNRERVALPSPAETVESRAAYEAQLLAEAGNPAERVMRQDEPSAVIEVSGSFRAYGNQWYAADRCGEPETFGEYDFTENSGTFRVLARSTLNPSLVQIEVPYPSRYDVYRQWINLEDLGDSFRVLGSDLESVPAKYPLRSFVADETLDIELIWEDPTWPDKSGVGVRSRDFNPVNSTQEFLLQSPTIGPDVIVEFVATGHYQLGNYVVISFPASVFQENELIMRRLSDDKKNHDPSQWREDGRIFLAFAHLSNWEEWRLSPPQPGTRLNSPEKGIIGMTGNTGTVASHLDLSVMYYGSADDGTQQMAQALKDVRWDEASANAYFGLAQRSSLVGDPRLYGENLDPVRIWPELDVLKAARYTDEESIYPWKN